MSETRENLASLILNLLIAVSTFWAVGYYFFAGLGIPGVGGTQCFKYFTTDSNVLAGFASLCALVVNVQRLRRPAARMPRWIWVLRFASTVAVAITMITVIVFLGPTSAATRGLRAFLGYYKGNTFVLHLSTPVLSLISMLWFERREIVRWSDCYWAVLPTFVYSVVYLILVVILGIWTDWYGFTFGGKAYIAPISMIVMYLVTLGVAALLKKLKRTATHAGGEDDHK